MQNSVVLFLHDILTNGPVWATTIEQRAAAHGFSKAQLKYAKQKMDVIAFKEKGALEGHWFWAMRQHAPEKEAVQ
jgi:hypothetical protein